MRDTEQKNGREFVLGRRGTSFARAAWHGRGGIQERVRGIPMPREKGGVYRRVRIIDDSLFLLAFPLPCSLSIHSTDLSTMFN